MGLWMNIFFKIVIFLIIVSNLTANTTIDSLQLEIKNAKNDSIKKVYFQNLINYTTNRYSDKAQVYIDQYKKFGENINNDVIVLHAEQFRAILFARTGKIKESNELLLNILPEVKATNTPQLIAGNYNLIGTNYNRLGKFRLAAENLNKSIEISKKHNINSMLGNNYIIMGILNSDMGQYSEAEQYYLKAIDIYSKLKDNDMLGLIYNNLASIYTQNKDYELALDYYDKSVEIDLAEGDSTGLAINYHNIGATMHSMGNKQKAFEYILLSKEIKTKIGNKISIAISDVALGEMYMIERNFIKAISHLRQAEKVLVEEGINQKLLNTYILLDSTYKLQGNYIRAYEYSKKFSDLKDSIYTKDQTQIVSELNARFDLENKEKENEILRIKNEQQSIFVIVAIIIIVLVAIFSILLYYKNKKIQKINNDLIENKKKIEEQNYQLETMNIELDAINKELIHTNDELKELNTTKNKFFSIISHDLKGPVYAQSSIVSIIADDYDRLSDDDKKEYLALLNDSTTHTSHLLENLLTWGRSQMGEISVNFDDFDLHANIEQTVSLLRSNANLKNITIESNCPENTMIHADPNLISTVIRNVTNNSIKFTPDGGRIKIEYSKPNEKEHLLIISDNGVGMSEKTAKDLFRLDKAKSTPGTKDEKGTGLGLIIVKEFIDKHNGSIWVKSEEGKGTKTFFTIPTTINSEH